MRVILFHTLPTVASSEEVRRDELQITMPLFGASLSFSLSRRVYCRKLRRGQSVHDQERFRFSLTRIALSLSSARKKSESASVSSLF